jgi:hypothetical protein
MNVLKEVMNGWMVMGTSVLSSFPFLACTEGMNDCEDRNE